MKKLFYLLSLFFIFSLTSTCMGQETYDLDKLKQQKEQPVKTTHTVIYNKKSYPIYRTAKGKLFIYVVSKTGNTYKKYLSQEELLKSKTS